ncbi:hypothetical protein [Ammoniphilus sp. 3BR4]|uniref:hypothetical protein n=1 Tax=Ammoniphilus sp. 3BR4 TaxID=3158265 RepID=UPI0034677FA1
MYEAYLLNQQGIQQERNRAGLKMTELIRDILFEYSDRALRECEQGVTVEL